MDLMEKITSLAKRRGFVYPGSEIYGGLANTYDYGPLGAELLRNIKNLWWDNFVTKRFDILGLDTNVLMNPKVWEASGHTSSFADTLVDCKNCKLRIRADHLIEEFYESQKKEIKVEGTTSDEQEEIINKEKIPCPKCGKNNWTGVRKFNQLFETHLGIITDDKSLAYLRGEIAQGMFTNFKNVLDSQSPKLPFGLAQSGIAFRNEITPGKFIHRTLTFNLSEFEYFFDPEKEDWEKLYEYWRGEMDKWAKEVLGIKDENLRWRAHSDEERSHYSKRTEDLEYKFPWGFKELYGFAYRTDYDLKNHMENSGTDLRYSDADGRKFIPHVLEPSFGMDRSLLAVLLDSYQEEELNGKNRVLLKFKPSLAPFKAAIFPLLANKPGLVDKARKIYESLKLSSFSVCWDERGNIGKRYFAQDEIGTPWCITIDFDTLQDDTVTVRDRDTAKQERVSVDKLVSYFQNKLK